MATIIGKVTENITLPASSNWNFWFYVNNGAWQSGLTVDKDVTTLYPIARPWLPASWDIEGDEVIALLEEDTSVSPPRYRHVYALNVQNRATVKRAFNIVYSELRP
jgi:hypothetical protein